MTVDTARHRLARLVRQQRLALGLSVRAAAKKAGVDRATWAGLEDGSRSTQDRHYAGIERALEWATGSIEAILASPSGRPILSADQPSPAGHVAVRLDELAEEWGEEVLQEAWRLREAKRDVSQQR